MPPFIVYLDNLGLLVDGGAVAVLIETHRLIADAHHAKTGNDEVYGLIRVGADAAKPAAETAGRFYWATDTEILYYDTGAAWVETARGESATRLAQLAERAHGSLTGVGVSDHHIKYLDAEALAAAWANIATKSLVNLLDNADFEVGDPPIGCTPTACTSARESTIVKIGSHSLKLHTATANYANGAMSISNYARYAGREVTLGVRYNCPVANAEAQYLQIFDGVDNTQSAALTQDGAWHWFTITHTVNAIPTQLIVKFLLATSPFDAGDILYIDGAMLVEGDSCPAFAPKPDQALICHHTADYAISAYEPPGTVHTNLGAGGVVTLTLPQVVRAGFPIEVVVMAAQQLHIDPGAAGAWYINGAKQTDDKYIWADAIGESTKGKADGNGDWVSLYSVGTWGVEP